MIHADQMSQLEQTRDELLGRVAEQRRFLTTSCNAFDASDHAEAKRIATAVQALLLGASSDLALLAQLQIRDQIGWLDTAGSILPLVAGAQTPLVYLTVDARLDQTRSSWLPTLDAWDRRLQARPRLAPDVEETLARMRASQLLRSRGSWLAFADWWSADVMRDMSGQHFTRADLVQALANEADEAHVDPHLDELYRRLTRPTSSGWAIDLEAGPAVPLLTPLLASVRQIAYEVETSLHRGAPAA
jgi:hypothetical protein